MNSGTSLQRTPWEQDKVAVVDRFKTRLNVWLFCSSGRTEVAVVERWPLAKVRLYNIFFKQIHEPQPINITPAELAYFGK